MTVAVSTTTAPSPAQHPQHLPTGGADQAQQPQLPSPRVRAHDQAVGGRDRDVAEQDADQQEVHPGVERHRFGLCHLEAGAVQDGQPRVKGRLASAVSTSAGAASPAILSAVWFFAVSRFLRADAWGEP
jgi:hypothetical protein